MMTAIIASVAMITAIAVTKEAWNVISDFKWLEILCKACLEARTSLECQP